MIPGVHHVTAIAGDPRANVEFYAGVLGLRLVKTTVNFDDPGTYHLYYGDERGAPGTLLTFFPWPGAPRGRRGTGQVTAIALSVPPQSLAFWEHRLAGRGVGVTRPETRFGERVLAFEDPDGLRLELAAAEPGDGRIPWTGGPMSAEHAVRGVHAVTLSEQGFERTVALLGTGLGFAAGGQDGSRFRYRAVGAGPGSIVDVLCLPDAPPGRIAVGTVHHVAWRTPGDDAQLEWRRRIAAMGLDVTPVLDRRYFHSIYFREPGGVIFEIATDSPGFTIDEPLEDLGTRLALPPWLESRRAWIEDRLPPLPAARPVAPGGPLTEKEG
jgi:glyoxalase family protein